MRAVTILLLVALLVAPIAQGVAVRACEGKIIVFSQPVAAANLPSPDSLRCHAPPGVNWPLVLAPASVAVDVLLLSRDVGPVTFELVGLGIDVRVGAVYGSQNYWANDIRVHASQSGSLRVRAYSDTTGALLSEARYASPMGSPVHDTDPTEPSYKEAERALLHALGPREPCSAVEIYSRPKELHTLLTGDYGSALCHTHGSFLFPGAQEILVRAPPELGTCNSLQPWTVRLTGLGMDGTYHAHCNRPAILTAPPPVNTFWGPLEYQSDWLTIPDGATASGSLRAQMYDHLGNLIGDVTYHTLDAWVVSQAD